MGQEAHNTPSLYQLSLILPKSHLNVVRPTEFRTYARTCVVHVFLQINLSTLSPELPCLSLNRFTVNHLSWIHFRTRTASTYMIFHTDKICRYHLQSGVTKSKKNPTQPEIPFRKLLNPARNTTYRSGSHLQLRTPKIDGHKVRKSNFDTQGTRTVGTKVKLRKSKTIRLEPTHDLSSKRFGLSIYYQSVDAPIQ